VVAGNLIASQVRVRRGEHDRVLVYLLQVSLGRENVELGSRSVVRCGAREEAEGVSGRARTIDTAFWASVFGRVGGTSRVRPCLLVCSGAIRVRRRAVIEVEHGVKARGVI